MEEKDLKMMETENEASKAIQKVKEAEEKARLMVDEARTKGSPEIIRKGTEESEELRKRIVAEARKQAESLKKEIIARAQAEAQAINQQTEVEKLEIMKKAEVNFNQAVEKTALKLLKIIESRKG
ncbi:MAG: hypothetical protein ACPLRA_03925 [Candidatus Saccharicenans sp.]